ncbi:MAG: hypothetical protein U0514_00715 [Candidatus Andersenbacteria bacterium]
MARRSSKRAAGSRKKDPAFMEVHYGQVITYVFVGAIIGLAIGALALLWVLRIQKDNAAASASLIRSQVFQQLR